MGEPGGLPSMGSHRVIHNWSNLEAAAAAKSLYIFPPPLFLNDLMSWIFLYYFNAIKLLKEYKLQQFRDVLIKNEMSLLFL